MLNKVSVVQIVMLSLLVMLISVSIVSAAVKVDTSALRAAITVEGVRGHQAAFQEIADNNGGTRAASTSGYDASVAYVVEQLSQTGYFDIEIQNSLLSANIE